MAFNQKVNRPVELKTARIVRLVFVTIFLTSYQQQRDFSVSFAWPYWRLGGMTLAYQGSWVIMATSRRLDLPLYGVSSSVRDSY